MVEVRRPTGRGPQEWPGECPEPRPGFALFVALLAVFLLLAAGALLAMHLQMRYELLRDQQRNMQLQNLLDSGYALIAASVREDYSFSGRLDLELGGGVVEMDVQWLVGSGIPTGTRRIEMAAFYGGETRRARGLLRIPSPGARPVLYGFEPLPPQASDEDESQFELGLGLGRP